MGNEPGKEKVSYWVQWDEIPWEEVNEHIHRKVVMGDRMMMVMYLFAPHQVWPREAHEAEQGGYILKGEIELNLPSEKKRRILRAGDGYLIGSNVPHSWRTLEKETLLIDLFSPPRKELIEHKFAPRQQGKKEKR
jgi:quercetin dioxygenase-like cupin family protein